jgi:16S rRNA C967 or C1407 C5-methylase (RsmB/RsmF family)
VAEQALARYRPLIDDWDAFTASCARPLPRTLWANSLAASPPEVTRAVEATWPQAEPLGWREHTWRLPAETPIGSTIPYRLGWLHAQEEAALWAVDGLALVPGMRVLDLCAAPGNKTAQIAAALGDRGMIVANERKNSRIASLRANLDRLGVTCAAVVRSDGVRFRSNETFDAVLVDGPCTCEGTMRRRLSGRGRDGIEAFRASISQTQTALLRNALRHVRPGGFVVYSTCTFAPEENEGVLDRVEDAQVVPFPDPGIRTTSGITRWGDVEYREDVRNARRVWPHHNDTGGFFVARLRKG